MDFRDQDAVDLLGPGLIEFGHNQLGSLRFIAIQAETDCRPANRLGRPAAEFAFDGDDDGHPTSGRGWAALEETVHWSGDLLPSR